MRLLLTRPVEDSKAFALQLAEIGIQTLIAPLMTIEVDAESVPGMGDVQAILFTSANGVRAFATVSRERSIPVFAVGDASAHAARDAGFDSVESAAGDVDDLARVVQIKCDPIEGALLHVAGSDVAGDLGGALKAIGHDYRRAVLYTARPAGRLPDEVAAALAKGALDGVALFSPRSAVILEALVEEAGMTPKLARLSAFALSENVAAALHAERWQAVNQADAPNAAAMLKVVSANRQTG